MSADGALAPAAGEAATAERLNDPAEVARVLAAMPFAAAWGVEVIAAGRGRVTLEAPLIPAHEAPPGAFAASAVGSLGDMAAMTSLFTMLPRGWANATLDFTVKMLAPAVGPRLRAEGWVMQSGRTTGVGAAEVSVLGPDGAARTVGTVLATGRAFRPARAA